MSMLFRARPSLMEIQGEADLEDMVREKSIEVKDEEM